MYVPWPQWYGEELPAADAGRAHWAWDYLNCAYQDGWLEIDGNGRIRPDEAVTAAEMAHALREV